MENKTDKFDTNVKMDEYELIVIDGDVSFGVS